MKITINDEKKRDFIVDGEGKLRTPMYFEKLSQNAKDVFISILESGNDVYEYEISTSVPSFLEAVNELFENGYITI